MITFYHFDSNPRFPPFLLYVRCKFGITFVRRCFRDASSYFQDVDQCTLNTLHRSWRKCQQFRADLIARSSFHFGFFWLSVTVNNFSVMSGRSHRFLSIPSTFWEVNVSCSRAQHGDLSEDRTPRPPGVRRSTTRPPRL